MAAAARTRSGDEEHQPGLVEEVAEVEQVLVELFVGGLAAVEVEGQEAKAGVVG
ncbi:hypothetical protein KGD82_27620 (plasmid) [Nocardiopsis eucommiae]|uniref:Uncharacterized protein n=1 Tax=Nocardiopsis eucommiae TaxID=2831970 RepID=A0A975LCH9_9ACTN|nr:hypothetical protein KGD82_27620 [Nocardiopsis eucommiae]